MRRARAAFTLIELAVVLAIVGVSGAAMGMLLLRQQSADGPSRQS